MNQHWTVWLLGGALAASLAWHGIRPTGFEVRVEGCDPHALALLDLSGDQQTALAAWQATAREQATCADDAASARLDELDRALRDPETAPERLHELAGDVSRLRAQELAQCVDSIVAVREILTREQLGELLDLCCTGGACKQ